LNFAAFEERHKSPAKDSRSLLAREKIYKQPGTLSLAERSSGHQPLALNANIINQAQPETVCIERFPSAEAGYSTHSDVYWSRSVRYVFLYNFLKIAAKNYRTSQLQRAAE
jgi:hypothetical protein